IGVDNYRALKQVSLIINEPSLTQLGSWRLTAVLHGTVATLIGNAAAVVSGTWGAVTRRAHQSGSSRTTVYMHAQRMVQAVASAQAGGSSYDALGHENERLKAENAALRQAWAEAEALSEAKQRAFAGSGWAMGLSLSQIVTLFAIVLPWGAVPSRAMIGRWVQAAAAQAGRLLVVLDLACRARVRVLCLDEIFLHRAPVLMAIELHSMAWMAGQRGPDRSGERWREVLAHWPSLEHIIADGGQGLARGIKLANAARCRLVKKFKRKFFPAFTDLPLPARRLDFSLALTHTHDAWRPKRPRENNELESLARVYHGVSGSRTVTPQ